MNEKTLALYIHVPYCLEKCPYCDFHSIAVEKNKIPYEEYATRLIEQLKWEVDRFQLQNRKLVSIFFGGGTPSLMTPEFFSKVLENVGGIGGSIPPEQKRVGVWAPPMTGSAFSNTVEITVETNPRTADKNQFKKWLALGINRISFGTQSFQDSLLQRLGRHHTAADSFRAVQEAKEAGFTNINCDLIFGIKDQTLQELEKDLQTVLSLEVPHVSAYQLTVEKNTPLSAWVEAGSYTLPAEDILVQMHGQVLATLERGGLNRYEISNYSKLGFQSRHNIEYWFNHDYLGIGSGAVSKIDNRRFRTTRKLKNYLAGDWSYEEEETLDAKTIWKEKWMMGLRLERGVLLEPREKGWSETFLEWQNEGFLKKTEGRIALTSKGFLMCNFLLQNIFALIDKVC